MKRVIAGFLICSAFLQAETLTLQECIDMTLKNHPDVHTFMLTVEQSQKDLASSKSAYRPQVAVHLEYDPLRTYVMPVMGKFSTDDDTLFHSDIVLNQKLWDFKKTSNRIAASRLQKDISRLSLEDVKNQLALRVEQVYDAVLLQESLIALRKKDLETKEALYKQALAMQKQGLRTKADAARFHASVFGAKEALSEAKAAYEKARNSLSFLIGEKLQNDVRFENHLRQIERLKLSSEKKKMLHEALLQNPSLQKMHKEIEKADKLYQASKSERYGSIDATLMASHEESLSNYDTKLVALKAELPLYMGGKLKAQMQKAKIAKAKAQMQYQSLLLKYREQLDALLIDLSHADVSIAAKKESIKAAKAALDVVRARYKEGLVTYLQLLDAVTLYESSQVAYIGALARKSDILYQIKSLTGADKL